MDVWLNGEIVPEAEAQISVFDSGFQHAVGLFETMTARHARVFRVMEHTQQLVDSAKALLMSNRLKAGPLAEACEQLLAHNTMSEARVRLTVTGGNMNMLNNTGDGHIDPTVLIVAQPPTDYPPIFFSEGVEVSIAAGRENPWTPMAGHKTLNYWPRIHALQMAGMVGTSEALWLDPAANLTCGCVSNVFIVRDGKLITPPARGEELEDSGPSPVRPGITRSVTIECAEAAGIECEYKSISVDELLASEEVFLTNSSWQLLPVKGLRIQVRGEDGEPAMQSHPIGEGDVGPISTKLRHDLLELIDRETRDLPADR